MWWQDLLWGFWNGLTAWIVLIAHVFGFWSEFPFYNSARAGNWYDFGYLLGMGSPVLGGGLGAPGTLQSAARHFERAVDGSVCRRTAVFCNLDVICVPSPTQPGVIPDLPPMPHRASCGGPRPAARQPGGPPPSPS